MTDAGVSRFGLDPHRLGGQRLGQCTQPAARRSVDAAALSAQEPSFADADEASGPRRVD